MDTKTDLAALKALHSTQVSEVMAKVAKSSGKCRGKLDTEFEWFYTWAVAIGGTKAQMPNVDRDGDMNVPSGITPIRIFAKNGKQSFYCDTDIGGVPKEVHEYYVPVIEPPIAEDALVLQLRLLDSSIVKELILGGYHKKETNGKSVLLILTKKNSLYKIYNIVGNKAGWRGALAMKAKPRFDGANEGDVFRYRNKPMKKATTSEIVAHISNHSIYDLVMEF